MSKHKKIIKFASFYFFLCIQGYMYSVDTLHILEKGETLYSLSRKYAVPLSIILERNEITDSRKITAGQKIYIPEIYMVEKGDTLYGIAKKKGISAQSLAQINNITDKTILAIGKLLVIPSSSDEKSTILPNNKSIEKKTSAQSVMQDPRSYVQHPIDKNALWPVSVLNISYLSGKLYGIVIDSNKDEPVRAIASGYVMSQGAYRGYGHVVFIQSKTKHIYVYCGLSATSLQKGDEVSFGQQIGTLISDSLTGKHRLYFMVYENNKPLDPAKAPRGS